jgi:BON domain-containing protein
MNDRFRNDRSRGGEPRWQDNASDQQRREDADRRWNAQSGEPQYSSAEDETIGSEWDRDRGGRPERGGSYGQSGGARPGQGMSGSSSPVSGNRSGGGSGFYSRGNAGMYGGGSGGGYVGGRGGSGYGGSTGTEYGGGSYGGYSGSESRFGGDQGGYGGTQGGYGGGQSGYGQGGYGGAQGGNLGAGSTRGDGQVAWGGSQSRPSGGFAGRGPKGYKRTDERIREEVCDRLSADDDVDASEIEVQVSGGEVTLEGTVQTRSMKHRAENLADEIAGVSDVHNRLRVLKGMLSEIKDKLTGEDKEQHYAGTGTKGKLANGTV